MSVIELPEAWDICGCANEPALRLLRDIMRCMEEESPPLPSHKASPEEREERRLAMDAWVREHIDRREKLAGGSANWELFMHYIDKMGWSEHGGGINSSWLTGEGKAALEILNGLELRDPN